MHRMGSWDPGSNWTSSGDCPIRDADVFSAGSKLIEPSIAYSIRILIVRTGRIAYDISVRASCTIYKYKYK